MHYVTKQCLFCQASENIEELYPRNFSIDDLTPEVFSARQNTFHFHSLVVRCRNCGLVFSRSILSDEALAYLYSKSKVTFSEYTQIIRKDYWACLEQFMGGAEKGSALEIGCSTGFFLDELLERGFREVHGVEPSVEAIEMASPQVKPNITSGFFKAGLFEEKKFGLVCSFQTLDHLSDPLDVVSVARDILKPGGLAYFITHNVDGLQARLLGEKSPIIDVEHIYLFNKKTLRRLLETARFQVLGVGNIANSYPLDYWLRMFPFSRGVKGTLRNTACRIGLSSMRL